MINLIINWGLVLVYVLLNSAGALLIKHKINQFGEVSFSSFQVTVRYFLQLLTSFEVIIGFLAIFLSAVAWIAALSKLELSIAYPVAIGLNFLVIITASTLFFGEALTLNKGLGIAFLILGLIFIGKA